MKFKFIQTLFTFLVCSLAVSVMVKGQSSSSSTGAAATSCFQLQQNLQNTSILAFNGITNSGLSFFTGDVDTATGTYTPGGATVIGEIHVADQVATNAQTTLTADIATLNAFPATANLGNAELGALNLNPGVYTFTSSTVQLTGTLTLNGTGLYIFKIGSTFTTASNAAVILTNGATACNVYWVPVTTATLGGPTAFVGTILAGTVISQTGSAGTTVNGRLLSNTQTVTFAAATNVSVIGATCNNVCSGISKKKSSSSTAAAISSSAVSSSAVSSSISSSAISSSISSSAISSSISSSAVSSSISSSAISSSISSSAISSSAISSSAISSSPSISSSVTSSSSSSSTGTIIPSSCLQLPQNVSILAYSGISNTGLSFFIGDVDTAFGTYTPGGATVIGQIHVADQVALNAQIVLALAIASAQSFTATRDLTGTDLGGLTLGPGVYSFSSSAALTGNLILNGTGNYIFQIVSSFTTATNSAVILTNNATACNVYWVVGNAATLIGPTTFVGTILAVQSISQIGVAGTTVNGRLLSNTGTVTFAGATRIDVTEATCNCSVACSTNSCLNGGTCNNSTGTPICTCTSRFSGPICASGASSSLQGLFVTAVILILSLFGMLAI